MLDATAIIVNYQSEEHVVELLKHLFARQEDCPSQIIVVDNSPESGLQNQLPFSGINVDYHPVANNIGFAAAVNRGLKKVSRKVIILLNPDSRPQPGCLTGLVETILSKEDAAVAGPRLIPFDQNTSEAPSATQIDPTLWTLLLEYTVANRLLPKSYDWLRRHYFVDPTRTREPVECAMVQGACFAFIHRWIDEVGDFDADRFFLYWEETDFCRRVRSKGGKILYCPEHHCKHLGGASFSDTAGNQGYFWKSFYNYQQKHHGKMYALLLRVLLSAGMGAEYMILWTLNQFRKGSDRKLLADVKTIRLRLRLQW